MPFVAPRGGVDRNTSTVRPLSSGLVARYGIKKTGFAADVAQALRFQKVGDYPKALCARLKADATARDTLIGLFGDLPRILAEAADPARRAERTSVGSQAAAAG